MLTLHGTFISLKEIMLSAIFIRSQAVGSLLYAYIKILFYVNVSSMHLFLVINYV